MTQTQLLEEVLDAISQIPAERVQRIAQCRKEIQKIIRTRVMNFGQALEVLKAGGLVTRAGWNGFQKEKWVYKDQGRLYFSSDGGSEGIWIASSFDLLAEDWESTGVTKEDVSKDTGNREVPEAT